jgi:PST family polysaccharide transporter
MSIAQKAARGAMWTIAFGLLARGIGVAGTLVMTHLVAPEVIGEVAAATILCMLFSWLTNWGFGQYTIVKAKGDAAAEVIWHCTVAHVVLGGGAMLVVALIGQYMLPWFDAASAAVYIPGMAIAQFLRRVGAIPEKLLAREMKFRAIGLSMAIGETTYAAVSVFLAWKGYGGMAVVWGNIAQALLVIGVLIYAAGWRSWLSPTPLRKERFRDMVRFGLPLGVEAVAHNASRYGDKMLMSRYFGTGPMGLYNMGYNLADIPAVYVGEQIGQVLLPSLAQLPPERRPQALERSSAMLALIIFPMAVGLAVIAPSLIAVALSEEWQGVAPLLTILAVIAVFRPITWTLGTYLEATEQTQKFMYLELAKLVILFAGIAFLQRWGIEAAASAVGIAYGFNAIAGVWMVATGPGPNPRPSHLLAGFLRPLLACGAMAGAVLAVRYGLRELGVTRAAILLPIEIAVGAVVYVPAAFLFATSIARDLIQQLRGLRRRG